MMKATPRSLLFSPSPFPGRCQVKVFLNELNVGEFNVGRSFSRTFCLSFILVFLSLPSGSEEEILPK